MALLTRIKGCIHVTGLTYGGGCLQCLQHVPENELSVCDLNRIGEDLADDLFVICDSTPEDDQRKLRLYHYEQQGISETRAIHALAHSLGRIAAIYYQTKFGHEEFNPESHFHQVVAHHAVKHQAVELEAESTGL